ncbi:hypothetical protein BCR34DRAFT_590166 [Clohesyomyces aquaticus]|uniref:IGFBP N-terminal domain-containing protein n=1 Tax=Clohesyomyces aquaticus TaxID=1231657 RepID=A0A1Y1ZBU6_9PLEO|nr:hypothetical protein BCR34DRAFT_590166 [Clohesyomyces aquaticus]
MKSFVIVAAALLSLAVANPVGPGKPYCYCKPPICPMELIAECKCKNSAAQSCYESYLAQGIQCPKPTPQVCGILARDPIVVPTATKPLPTAKPSLIPLGPSCAGFIGLSCPDASMTCIDAPNDGCDPKHGGADCPGICVGPRVTCGGLKGGKCPAQYKCVDDPNDSCDPLKGGADCIGICVWAGGWLEES